VLCTLHSFCLRQQFSEHSKSDLMQLLLKARRIRSFHDSPGVDYLPCRWLYRHKPAEYFQQIFTFHGNLMRVYIKDNNGDPKSCINGRLNGLFFSADVNPKTGKPKWRPIYGNRRLRISASKMFEFASNLYFADVYCNSESGVHHVTLVLTNPGSAADWFCSEKLVPLSKTDRQHNPFLFFKGTEVYVSTKLMVEVLFTEDVDIGRCLREKECDAFFDVCYEKARSQRHLGRRKSPNCPLCNL